MQIILSIIVKSGYFNVRLNRFQNKEYSLSLSVEVQLILIICGFHICEFTYLPRFICNSKISLCGAFVDFCSHTQSGKKFELSAAPCSSWDWAKQYCLLSNSHTVNKCPFHSLFSATFFAFLTLLLVILMFKMAPSITLKCLVLLNAILWCAF